MSDTATVGGPDELIAFIIRGCRGGVPGRMTCDQRQMVKLDRNLGGLLGIAADDGEEPRR